MCGYDLNVRTRMLGQVASATHLNSPSLIGRPTVVAALPLVLP